MGVGWLVIVVLTIPFIPVLADAQINSTIIIQLDQKIIEQNEIIKKDKEFIQENKDYLEQQRELAAKSWDALLTVEPAEKGVNNAILQYKDDRNHLKVLLIERSNQYKIIRLQSEQLTQEKIDENIIKNPANLVRLVGVDISTSCVLSDKCLNYSDIIHLDSSNTRISGEFIEINGDIRRDKSPLEDSWRWYDMDDKLRVIVDPPNGMSDRIKMVTISNLGIYFSNNDMSFNYDMYISNTTRTWQEDRFVDNCNTAIIKNDLDLLDDTINYLRTGCTITNFNSTRYEIITPSYFDPTTSPNWQFTQWVNESKIKCKTLCFEY